MIFNAVALCISVLLIMVDSENLDWSLPMMGTLSMMTVVAYLLKRYVEEFVNLDKI